MLELKNNPSIKVDVFSLDINPHILFTILRQDIAIVCFNIN